MRRGTAGVGVFGSAMAIALDTTIPASAHGSTERMSVSSSGRQGNSASYVGSISADGRFVVFSSYASNLVPGDTNSLADAFVHDRQTGTTERVSLGLGGVQGEGYHSYGEAISANGRFVAFQSGASNLVPGDTNGATDVFVRSLVP